jgi:hypothetical protein
MTVTGSSGDGKNVRFDLLLIAMSCQQILAVPPPKI